MAQKGFVIQRRNRLAMLRERSRCLAEPFDARSQASSQYGRRLDHGRLSGAEGMKTPEDGEIQGYVQRAVRQDFADAV